MPRHWVWVIPILFYVALLSIPELDADTLYIDELRSITHLGGIDQLYTPDEMLQSLIRISPQHTPGYFLLLGGWVRLVGYAPAALRYFSVLLGLLSLAWTYRLVTDQVSTRAGLFAAALMGTSIYYVYYMHQMRMYTLLVLLIILELWFYFRLIDTKRPEHVWEWPGLFVTTLALIYTHTFAVFLLAAIGGYHLLAVKKTRRWWAVAGIISAAVIFLIPWVSVILGAAQVQDKQVSMETVLRPAQVPGFILYLFGNGYSVLGGVTLIGLMTVLYSQHKVALRVGFITLVMGIAVILANSIIPLLPVVRGRYVLIFWPVLTFLLGTALAQTQQRRLAQLVIAGWLISGLTFRVMPDFNLYTNRFIDNRPFPDFGHLLTTFHQYWIQPQPHNFVLFPFENNSKDTSLIDYTSVFYFKLLGTSGDILRPHTLTASDLTNPDTLVSQELAAHPVVWFVYEPTNLTDDEIEKCVTILELSHVFCETVVDQPNLNIARYVQSPLTCSQ